MIITVLIALIGLWSMLGALVLYNLDSKDFKPSFRLALVTGPILVIIYFVLIFILQLVEELIKWIKKA